MSEPLIVFLDAGTIGDDISWPDFASLGRIRAFEHTKPEEIAERLRDAEIVLTNKAYITAEHIAAAPKLKYIGTLATGYNQVDGAAAAARGIPLCNVPAYSTFAVAQHVFALLLNISNRISQLVRSVEEGDWSRSRHFCYWKDPLFELHGKTFGVVGFGDIGSEVARLAHSFGMRVLAYVPRPKPAPEYTPFAFVELEELFRQSDVISLHCPLTPENEGMVNASLLGRMKRTGILINTARGPLVNEQDLAQALSRGTIGAAALDVVTVEPMTPDNPLQRAPNCFITPHVAWSTAEARVRLMQGVFDNVRNFLNGTPTNVRNGV